MNIDMKTIGYNIKKLREAADLGQKQIATYLHVDQSLISKFETGERCISADMIDKLAALFCCPITSITSQEESTVSMAFAFRTTGIDCDDLQALAIINRIALNQMQMDTMIKEE